MLVREATFDFWQNLQFVIALAGFAMIAHRLPGLPGWLAAGARSCRRR